MVCFYLALCLALPLPEEAQNEAVLSSLPSFSLPPSPEASLLLVPFLRSGQ